MSWVSAILKNILMKKNTNFKNVSFNGRVVDERDQTVTCTTCKFVAPTSISYEEYLYIHDKFNIVAHGKPCAGGDVNSETLMYCNLNEERDTINLLL
ncbi:hypothetical protein [Orgyia leucostigma nucleopolyhedrovirus]|uniref:Uncharacterized protein n=1 Tax=Orgyia leucostigma nucleopolyhedrovirus TaxID=490711 RepID=B0FDQ4_9ABAC|nr:hypothetical protein [Orgyia leucostigma nucleopolyhedrovirus]ABY65762.1 hypothetical protein [Orgyia leucostigma nucleopolyhedrovirus]